MNHTIRPQGTDFESRYRAGFVLSEHSARHLRRILRLHLAAADLLEVADAAELALTELVGNVVRHVPGRRCRMCFLLRPGAVRVEVADSCRRLPAPAPENMDASDEAETGRGLLLLQAVTDRWGAEPHPDGSGKTVWFECLAKPPTVPDFLSRAASPAPRP
ncbi:ATP-binding protein [Streptomyces poonensis]|uniref:Histidine kinase/HSP90-like ATPase domain-containing protein n=1 Tax=Streptomyces poonensis TaxID=68255 RepID=A0A918PIA7_9ACTN|nr:ATP-binding protein [Streptomyces poonensis]GGZ11516.1 hypothetical protein GCM10010365_33850 [Streptomyces poonensis]GLJ91557.1 hypothetical protein GCM10017589_41640 [Streptomyces poonensis]